MRYNSPKDPLDINDCQALSFGITRLYHRARRSHLAALLRKNKKRATVWPVLKKISRPVSHVRKIVRTERNLFSARRFKTTLPIWSLIIVLLLGVATGFYASTALSQATGTGESRNPDFTVQASSPNQTIIQGSLTSFSLLLSSLNSFAGSVNLNATLTPVDDNITIGLNPSSVSLLTGTGTSTLTVSTLSSAPLGAYTLAVGATSGRITHSVTLFVHIARAPSPDFTIVSIPSSMTIFRGSSGSFNLNLTSISGFSGTISLAATITPGGANSPMLSLNPNSLTLLAGGTGNAVLTVTTSGTTTRGGYVIVALAASGTTSHTVTIVLTIQ